MKTIVATVELTVTVETEMPTIARLDQLLRAGLVHTRITATDAALSIINSHVVDVARLRDGKEGA